MTRRPPNFRLNSGVGHPLAKGLMFFGGGRSPKTDAYHDSSVYKNTGTLTAMDPQADWVWSPELGRFATSGDGATKYVNTNSTIFHPSTTATQITICGWMNTNSISADRGFIGKRGTGSSTSGSNNTGFQFGFNGSVAGDPLILSLFGRFGQQSNASGIAVGTWYHVCVTYNAANVIFYINGTELSSHAQTLSYVVAENNIYVGAFNNRLTLGNPFDGLLSDFMILDGVLSDDEVSAIAAAGNVDLRIGGVPLILPPERVWFPAWGATQGGVAAAYRFRLARKYGVSL